VGALLTSLAVAALSGTTNSLKAQAVDPSLLDPNLGVRTVARGLITPTTMAFIGDNDILVLEKNTGKVQRVVNGVIRGPVLSLPVNFFSERGLLGIALHPDFPKNPGVYLYWSESSIGQVTGDPAAVRLLGNRVDRFVWNGSTLTFERNLIKLRALQVDPGQPVRGNHDGGVMVFEPRAVEENGDQEGKEERKAKLLIIVGDVGRRGQLQNIPDGPFGRGIPDDQFGGPEPDNAHLTGVVLRLNDDGTTPEDNPFFEVGEEMGGEVGANIQKLFAYGVRNSFGLAFDPESSSPSLWNEDNGSDSFDEINRVEPGYNGGWIQVMGPISRIGDYKTIESAVKPPAVPLQQLRWPPSRIAGTPEEALKRMFVLPGSHYTDPEFSWKFELPPAAIGFVKGDGLGSEFRGDLFVGAATLATEGGYLLRFKLTPDRKHLDVPTRVAEQRFKHDLTGSERLLIGKNFGITTSIKTGPNGNLFVVSLTRGEILEIFRRAPDKGD